MSIEVIVGSKLETKEIDWLPAKLDSTDPVIPAKSKVYWRPKCENNQSKVLVSSFRGRELNGEKIELPNNYTGYVLNEYKKPCGLNKKLYTDGKFKEITYWNWNKNTSSNDVIRRAMEWLDIAEVLHESCEELENN